MPDVVIFPRHQATPTRALRPRHGRQIRNETHGRFGFMPAARCDSWTEGRFYLCGSCFALRGDGPITSSMEIWVLQGFDLARQEYDPTIVPPGARCEDCGGPAWPRE